MRRLFLILSVLGAAQNCTALDLVGYLPYYRMGASYNQNMLPIQLGMLNEIRYFGLTAASDGSIIPLSGSGTLQSHLNNIATIKQKIEAMPIALRPRLDITLGGAGEDASFTNIARTVSGVPCNLCTTFAQNIASLLNSTGATSVDIDWEHPDAGVERSTSYPDMLKRIKHEVGASRRVYAVVDPTVVISNGVLSGTDAIDGISLMTYDLGWWGNDPGNPYQGEHSLPEYVTNSVDAWTEPPGSPNDRPWVFGTWGNNVPAGKLGVGQPFYSHTVTSPDVANLYSELLGSTTTDTNYFTYQGRSVWLPGPGLAEQRVQFAQSRGLQHIIIWEIGQDLPLDNPYSLLYRAYLKNSGLALIAGDYDADRDADGADYTRWRSMFGQSGYGRAADGSANQAVDAGDYVLWRKSVSGTGSGAVFDTAVPEPSAACLGAWLLLVPGCRRRRMLR
jgi:glycosyl hydrolase family 18 (putative chitinase)